MTARVDIPAGVGVAAQHAVASSNAGKRTVRRVVDGLAGPDEVMHGLLDQLEAEGRILPPSVRMRAYLREVQKALETAREARKP